MATPADNPIPRLEKILRRLLDHRQIHCAVLAVRRRGTGLDWQGAGGVAHPGGPPMTADTPFPIASVTKMFTAAVVMQLHQSGRLNLHDRISDHLPEPLIRGIHTYRGEDFSTRLTVEDLLTHRSGLADYYEEKVPGHGNVLERLLREGDYAWTTADVTELVRAHLKPHFPPGADRRAHYSDTNFTLLGEILERVEQTPLAAIYDERIVRPLGLSSTWLYGAQPAGASEPASIWVGDRTLQVPLAMGSMGAQGGIISTVTDSLRFLEAFFDGALFPASLLPRMQQWRRIFYPLQYGHGLMRFSLPWWLAPFQARPEFIGHSGSTGSLLFHAPAQGLYVAGTVNQVTQYRRPFQVLLRIAAALA